MTLRITFTASVAPVGPAKRVMRSVWSVTAMSMLCRVSNRFCKIRLKPVGWTTQTSSRNSVNFPATKVAATVVVDAVLNGLSAAAIVARDVAVAVHRAVIVQTDVGMTADRRVMGGMRDVMSMGGRSLLMLNRQHRCRLRHHHH